MSDMHPLQEEALRLVTAFYCIMEPDRRAEVMALAEAYTATSPEYVQELARRTQPEA